MKIYVVVEKGYEDGDCELISAHYKKPDAWKKYQEMKENIDPEDSDWLWYEIAAVDLN